LDEVRRRNPGSWGVARCCPGSGRKSRSSTTTPWSVRSVRSRPLGPDTPGLSSATSRMSMFWRGPSASLTARTPALGSIAIAKTRHPFTVGDLTMLVRICPTSQPTSLACPAGTVSWSSAGAVVSDCSRGASGILPHAGNLAVACRRSKVATGLAARQPDSRVPSQPGGI
jgi:hypothetical protein